MAEEWRINWRWADPVAAKSTNTQDYIRSQGREPKKEGLKVYSF